MNYTPAAIYSLDGNFLGYGIMTRNGKLQSTNVWGEHESDKLQKRLDELNADSNLKAFWPHPQDPEVLQILADERFMPIEYTTAEVVDDERSHYVWKQEPQVDEHGGILFDASGRPIMIQGSEINKDASVIRYKQGKVPKNPSDVLLRIKAASEVVARRRAQEAGIVLSS